jgi:pyroglutamyl-peptidase
MLKTVLVTSFSTWLPHQLSNSSDDLVGELLNRVPITTALHTLRQLPVDFYAAPRQVLRRIATLQPHWIVCCGMAESRQQLTVESTARLGTRTLTTAVDLHLLIQDLSMTAISDDAGQFVCERLYYDVLDYLQTQNSSSQCIFVHVPPFTLENRVAIVADFLAILARISAIVV